MVKNKAFHAIIIGTCIFVNSIAGVYADTAAPDTPISIQLQQVNTGDKLTQKQSEIDRYVFEKHAKDFADKGIAVTSTGVIGDNVEVGITPFNEENANYIYEILGKDEVKVVEGIQATTLGTGDTMPEFTAQLKGAPEEAVTVSAQEEKAASPIAAFFNNIWEWIKSIF